VVFCKILSNDFEFFDKTLQFIAFFAALFTYERARKHLVSRLQV